MDPYELYYGPEETSPDDEAYEAFYGPSEEDDAEPPPEPPKGKKGRMAKAFPRALVPLPALGRRALLDLIKALARVRAHTMTTRSGKVVNVREHTRNFDPRAIAKELADKMRARAGAYVHGAGEVDPDGRTTQERFARKVKAKDPEGNKGIEYHYTDERIKLHQALIRKRTAHVAVSKKPVAILTAGGSASGKSSLLPIIHEQFGDQLALIDADSFKKDIPEFGHKLQFDRENAAIHAHVESSHLCQKTIEHCLKNNKSFVYDNTFSHGPSTQALIDHLKDRGYEVHIRYADLPVEEAQRREERRFRDEGRRVPREVLERLHHGAIETFSELAHSGHSVQVYNTNVAQGERPPLAYSHSEDEHFEDAAHLANMARRGHAFMKQRVPSAA